jgi:hypothetical protein
LTIIVKLGVSALSSERSLIFSLDLRRRPPGVGASNQFAVLNPSVDVLVVTRRSRSARSRVALRKTETHSIASATFLCVGGDIGSAKARQSGSLLMHAHMSVVPDRGRPVRRMSLTEGILRRIRTAERDHSQRPQLRREVGPMSGHPWMVRAKRLSAGRRVHPWLAT